jgi:uncharacterized protein
MKTLTLDFTMTLLLSAAFLAGNSTLVAAESAPKLIHAVIITGVDWKGHLWKETGPAIKDILEADPRFKVEIKEDPAFLASDELVKFDLVVLNFKNYEPVPQEKKAIKNLLDFVAQGKGLVSVHFASGAFTNHVEFRNLVGRAQKTKHDKRGPFTVKITNPNHPVTRGMRDFETDDELFIELQGDQPIEVLAVARSNITNQDHPMAFVLTHGKGRVFHTTLGHDVKAFTMPGTSELIRRGAAWAAGIDPQP